MKVDFTRDTFDAGNSFSRVLMQQGRVTLDADFNEQGAILLNYIRMLARDLIGLYGAPSENAGFKITLDQNGISISAGRYYVDGIPVENKKSCLLTQQPYYGVPDDDPVRKLNDNRDQWFWLYLDVWERPVTSIEMEAIRETALGGPDTCARAQYVWQVKAMPVDSNLTTECSLPLDHLLELSKIQLAARVNPGKKITDPCVTSPASKYVGVENHLYRVEIHRGGSQGVATFKWSRDNGSVVAAWLGTRAGQSQGGIDLVVGNTHGFTAGCWVEITDEDLDLKGAPGPLVKVAKVESGALLLDSTSIPAAGLPDPIKMRHPKVTRWDQTEKGDIQLEDGAVKVVETPVATNADQAGWLDLEDGIQIAFAQLPFGVQGEYRSGDYWLIPARIATGAIEWPPSEQAGKMSLISPRGVRHHYAPLAFVGWENNQLQAHSCFCEFAPINSCFQRNALPFGGENSVSQPRILEGVNDRERFASRASDIETDVAPKAARPKRARKARVKKDRS